MATRHSRLTFAWLALALATVNLAGCTSGNDSSTGTTVTTGVPETTTTTEPPLEAGRQVFVFTPAIGQCFDRRSIDERPATGPQQTDIVLVLDCALPHQNEVFDVLKMPNSPHDYPGETAMQDFARANCTTNFMSYVGRPYEVSDLEVGYYLPSSNEWDQGARTLGCYVYDVSGDKLVGSMQGTAR